jgi:glycosyltransferase involved in cell wall biosynthesis
MEAVVSVVIPCYNATAFIGQALLSLQQQRFAAWEAIVVDDGSTDDLPSALRPFEQDPRIRYLRLAQNGGISIARNAGIAASTAKYVALLDADDCFHPDNLAQKVAHLEANPTIGAVLSNCATFSEDTSKPIATRYANLEQPIDNLLFLKRTVVPCPSVVVIRRSSFETVGLFDPDLMLAEDWEYWLRLLSRTTVHNIPLDLVYYRIHGEQSSRKIALWQRFKLLSYQKARPFFRNRWHYYHGLSNLYLIFSANYYHHTSNHFKVLYFLVASILLHPLPILRRMVKLVGVR